jgi:hypothetical protein
MWTAPWQTSSVCMTTCSITCNTYRQLIASCGTRAAQEPTAQIAVCFIYNYCYKFENGVLFFMFRFSVLVLVGGTSTVNCQGTDFICFVSQNICLLQIWKIFRQKVPRVITITCQVTTFSNAAHLFQCVIIIFLRNLQLTDTFVPFRQEFKTFRRGTFRLLLTAIASCVLLLLLLLLFNRRRKIIRGIADSTVKRKWKLLFMNGWECRSPISIANLFKVRHFYWSRLTLNEENILGVCLGSERDWRLCRKHTNV